MKITNIPKHERPRERLFRLGPSALSDAELLAIFLRTGKPGTSAIQLAYELINHFGSLAALMSADPTKLSQISGIGAAKSAQLQAILELGKRYLRQKRPKKNRILNSKEAKELISLEIDSLDREVFACLFLDAHNHIISFQRLFSGSVTESHVYLGTVVQAALEVRSVHVICAHNHPSGNIKPSKADILLTQQLKAALALVDIKLIDHIIAGGGKTYSMADHGLA